MNVPHFDEYPIALCFVVVVFSRSVEHSNDRIVFLGESFGVAPNLRQVLVLRGIFSASVFSKLRGRHGARKFNLLRSTSVTM